MSLGGEGGDLSCRPGKDFGLDWKQDMRPLVV